MNDIKSELSALALEYKNALKKAVKISDEIYRNLKEYYTPEKIKSFKNFEDFLEDINYVCETNSTGMLLFIKMVQENYF
jgi:hypothetical protein